MLFKGNPQENPPVWVSLNKTHTHTHIRIVDPDSMCLKDPCFGIVSVSRVPVSVSHSPECQRDVNETKHTGLFLFGVLADPISITPVGQPLQKGPSVLRFKDCL